MSKPVTETDLYAPVKALLEAQGYTVKAEIGAADIVALRDEELPVIVELKKAFSLTLIHQAIKRLKVTDKVYVAVLQSQGRRGWKAFIANKTLCRRLGLGLITIASDLQRAQVHLDPGPYAPRKSKTDQTRLLKEFQTRVGDPNIAGSNQTKLVTAYRQDALRCLNLLHKSGPTKASIIAENTEVSRARQIMSDDHYGWFERVERGVYTVTPKGREAVKSYATELETLQ
ncbi:MAG: DUF2161 family putative PD-(D/E)XK-type phosphodiesterase [Pseudomonadota bacterium]